MQKMMRGQTIEALAPTGFCRRLSFVFLVVAHT